MSADYRNLLVSKRRVDWSELKLTERELYEIYEMKIKYGYVYFVHTTRHHILFNAYLPYYRPSVILIHQNDCGSSIELLEYTGGSIIKVDSISDDFIYDEYLRDYEREEVLSNFIELFEPALIKVDKKIELSDETLEAIATIYKNFIFKYDELSEDIKSQMIKIH